MELSEDIIKQVKEILPTENDLNFFLRMWSTDANIYKHRLEAIGFNNLDDVLDAGAGFGQWAFCLAEMNKNVVGLELDENRVASAKIVAEHFSRSNLKFVQGSIEELPFDDNSFDAVYCYSVIFMSDFHRSMKEFYRVLKPEGRLYFCANGYGWYFFNLIENHNPSSDFSPRKMALKTFVNTFKYYLHGKVQSGDQYILSKGNARKIAKRVGFKNIEFAGDGKLSVNGAVLGKSFYETKKYGMTNIYEALCQK